MSSSMFLNASSRDVQIQFNGSTSTFLITGGSGIVGLHLIANLIEIGLSPSQISATFHRPLPLQVQSLFKGVNWLPYEGCFSCKYDNIIHAATYAQPLKYAGAALQTCRLNSLDLFNLIDACLNPDGRFLYVSSSDVYRGNNDLPNRETQLGLSDPWSARSCYTESKRFGETLCAAFLASGRIVRVARLALGYGAGNRHDDKRVMYEFIRQALKFRKIEMADEGSALRTYISMCDVSRMMLNIMFCGKFPVYNVGGVSRLSILELASLISDLTNSDLVVGEGKSTSAVLRAAPADVWLDVSRYLDEFPGSFESLKEGLSKVILWNTHQS